MIFSVIVPFRNEERYIRDCISSLLRQDFDKNEYELIFVNNNSTDMSEDIVCEYREITLLEEKRGKEYTARNKALRYAKGDIIAFTDADCVVSRDWLSQIYTGMRKNEKCIVLGKRHYAHAKSPLLRIFEEYKNAHIEYLFINGYRNSFFGYTNNMAVSAGLFKMLGGFSEKPCAGDTEFMHRCLIREPDTAIRFLSDMRVVHLEITSVMRLLRKCFHYGEFNAFLKEKRFAGLECYGKSGILKYCVTKYCYGFKDKALLVLALMLNDIFFKTGKIKGDLTFFAKKYFSAEFQEC